MTVADTELALLLEKDTDELYRLLGAELLGEPLGLGPADFRRQLDFSRRWLDGRRRMLQRLICHDPRVKQMIITNQGDLLAECVAVLEILNDGPTQFPHAAALAVLIVRLGLTGFCADATRPTD